MPTCNSTLGDMRVGDEGATEEILVGNLTFHQLGLIISGVAAIIGIVVATLNIWLHALNYTKPSEQKNIIRILFMVPVYCVASWCSFKYTWWTVYFTAIADAYEAIAIASFFSLLTFYVGPNIHDQKEYFRTLTNIKMWIWPVKRYARLTGGPEKGPFRTPKSGLTWFNIVWTGVFQYCFVMSMLAILSTITEATDRFCTSSESPAFFHLWDTIFKTISVIVAMLSIIQTYIQMKEDLSQYNPLLKIVAIKLVIFLSFWQNFVLNILTSPTLNAITPTKYLAYPDIRVGIPMMLLCIEMAIFSVFHLFAFSYRPYRPGPHNTYKYPIPSGLQTGPLVNEIADKRLGGFLGFKAFLDAANIIDIISGVARGARWVIVGRKTRHQDKSYGPKTDGSLHDVSLENTNTEYSGSKAYEMPRVAATPDDHANLLHHAGPDPSMSPHSPQSMQNSPVQNQGPYADGWWDQYAIDEPDLGEAGQQRTRHSRNIV